VLKTGVVAPSPCSVNALLGFRHLIGVSSMQFKHYYTCNGWLGSRAVSVLDSGAVGPGFKSQPRRGRVTVLGKLFTPIVPLFTKQQNGSSPLKGCGGNCICRPGGKQAYRRVYDSRHLQADCQEPGSAPEPYAR